MFIKRDFLYEMNNISTVLLLLILMITGISLLHLSPLYAKKITVPESLPRQEKSDLESQVVTIFEKNCTNAGCHSGTTPQMGLKLTEDAYYSTTVNQPSQEKPALLRINPGKPDSSYLVMKILGREGISGMQMPFGRDPLADEEISLIIEWIKGMDQADISTVEEATAIPLLPFNGWKVVNIPTTRTVDAGRWLFLIGHRFFPKINEGYDALYGLDGPANIFLNLGYAFTNDFYVKLGRSNVEDNVELTARYGFKNQYPDDKIPIAGSLQLAVNWISEKREGKDRLRSEALKFTTQASFSHQIRQGMSVIVVPGILFNPDSETEGEDPMVTLGVGGKVHVYKSISLVGEWVPIVSGYILTESRGRYNRFDSWGGGMELDVGGHVFQIIVSNSTGLTTDQYLRGGDLDITEGDLRLGFNIFRILQF